MITLTCNKMHHNTLSSFIRDYSFSELSNIRHAEKPIEITVTQELHVSIMITLKQHAEFLVGSFFFKWFAS